ncbi:MAG: hypothetical protein DRO88_06685 [Promethearchaeia archaeon]|nr:MAG: hypothetical protein DRO88_06685 [Candidatus Lokiarchaeia archaeon]
MSNQRDYNQVEMVRLKLYIPLEKYHQWMHYLKQNHPNSQFFTNFSNWVRTALIKLPSPGVSPLFPKSIENLSNDHSARKMLEKVVWIKKSTKMSLLERKGHFSLNSYVILILDIHTFGISSFQSLIYQILQLQSRVNEIEEKVRIIDEKLVFFKE